MRTVGEGRQRKLLKVSRRVAANSGPSMQLLHQMLTANVNKKVLPPKCMPGKKWAMVDSGSQPNVSNCAVEFPDNDIRESEGQRMGLRYKTADGSLVPNQGEIEISHLEPDGEIYNFVVQHANVHCTIISVRYLVTRDCTVTFHKSGGYIGYPTGKRIQFVLKERGVLRPPQCGTT